MASADWRVLLFGNNLIKCSTNELFCTLEALNSVGNNLEIIYGIYFSFANIKEEEVTEKLVNLYTKLNESSAKYDLKLIQIVMWSNLDTVSDIEKSFSEYISGMPWFAIPLKEAQVIRTLAQKFGPRSGGASLLLLDSEGRALCSEARDRLIQDPAGLEFPWRPRHVDEILEGVTLLKPEEGTITYNGLPADCIRGFYFSAHWCPPCRAFVSQLQETVDSVKKKQTVQWEILFVSSDRSKESFDTHRALMPWLCVPWESESTRTELARALNVRAIPTLVLIDQKGALITTDGRGEVTDDPEGFNFPWKPRPVNFLTERYAAKMHDFPAIVLFLDDDSDLNAVNILNSAAEKYYGENHIDVSCHLNIESLEENFLDYHFLFSFENMTMAKSIIKLTESKSNKHKQFLLFLIAIDSETSDILREFVGLEDTVPLLTAIDIPREKLAIMDESLEISVENVKQFVQKFVSGEIECSKIKSKDTRTNTD